MSVGNEQHPNPSANSGAKFSGSMNGLKAISRMNKSHGADAPRAGECAPIRRMNKSHGADAMRAGEWAAPKSK